MKSVSGMPFLWGLLAFVWFSMASAAGSGQITLNFVNADVGTVIKAMSEMTGRTFVVDPRVKGTINITSPRPVPATVAYDILLSTLRMQGYAAIQVDGVVRIVPEADAKFYAAPATGKSKRKRVGGEMVTRVFKLKHESAVQLQVALRPLLSANSTMTAEPGLNTLVVTDYADNVANLEQVVDSLDTPSADEPVLIPLKYASAQELASLINRVFMPGAAQPGALNTLDSLQVGVDERSNSLIIRGRDRSLVGKVQNLAQSLDVPTPAAGNVHVIYLKNAQAVEVAKTLRSIVSADSSSLSAATPTSALSSPQAASTQTSTDLNGKGSNGMDSGGGMIQADPSSNALIITAPEAVYNNLKATIDMLDVRRAQVLVEALIAEVSADKAAEFGIQWMYLDGAQSGKGTSALGGFGSSSSTSNISTIAANPAAAAKGLSLGLVKGTITLPDGTTIANLGLLARALETRTNANILSTPTLLTLDNEEAKISVGSNVPFLTGQYSLTGTSGTASPFQTIERKDVGLTLKVKPQISEGGTVRLAIAQEVSKLRQSAGDTTLASTDKRSIESTVLVDDGQIIVLGGLIDEKMEDVEDKVPLLGDIPLLGHLFRYNTRQHTKTNLMVFLRPVIVRDAATAAAVTHPRYDYIVGQQKAAAPDHHPMLPDIPPTVLKYDMELGNNSPTSGSDATAAGAARN